jgi:hypothetical protein
MRRPIEVANLQGIEEEIVNILRARCSLDVMPSIECVPHEGMEFVVVTCPQGGRKPYLVRGETWPYVRVGSSDRQAQDEEVRRLYIEGSEGDFEAPQPAGNDLQPVAGADRGLHPAAGGYCWKILACCPTNRVKSDSGRPKPAASVSAIRYPARRIPCACIHEISALCS